MTLKLLLLICPSISSCIAVLKLGQSFSLRASCRYMVSGSALAAWQYMSSVVVVSSSNRSSCVYVRRIGCVFVLVDLLTSGIGRFSVVTCGCWFSLPKALCLRRLMYCCFRWSWPWCRDPLETCFTLPQRTYFIICFVYSVEVVVHLDVELWRRKTCLWA